jgi:type IV pilus assembly protein PilQ
LAEDESVPSIKQTQSAYKPLNTKLNLNKVDTSAYDSRTASKKFPMIGNAERYMSIGERTYYIVTSTDFIGSQIPQTSTITNYQPIDAEMALEITPLVSGDRNITLDINVLQSTFNGERIDQNAPPGQESREFTSTIRVKDQDVVILGGLEERSKADSGTGVPFLSRIPILKWFFSSKKKETSKKKLSILIKPTIID